MCASWLHDHAQTKSWRNNFFPALGLQSQATGRKWYVSMIRPGQLFMPSTLLPRNHSKMYTTSSSNAVQPPAMESRTVAVTDDDVEVLDTDAEGTDGFAAYFAEANKASDREVRRMSSLHANANHTWSLHHVVVGAWTSGSMDQCIYPQENWGSSDFDRKHRCMKRNSHGLCTSERK